MKKLRYFGVALIIALVVVLAIDPERVIAAAKAYTIQVSGPGGPWGGLKVYDEDAMGSNSDTGIPTQQSVKAYVDTKLAGTAIGAAKGVWVIDNGLAMEGNTADGSETTLTVTNPTADVNYVLPDAAAGTYYLAVSSLATNAVGAASSVWLADDSIVCEGNTADAHETTITFPNATADVVYQFNTGAAGTYAPVVSELDLNFPDNTGAVWMEQDALVFEGATDGASAGFETTLTIVDPSADRTATIPNSSGVFGLTHTVELSGVTVGSGLTAEVGSTITIGAGELSSGRVVRVTCNGTITGANDAKDINLTFGDAVAGGDTTFAELDFAAAYAGDYQVDFTVVLSGASTVTTSAVGVVNGHTVVSDYKAGTYLQSTQWYWAIDMDVDNSGDEIAEGACIWRIE